MVPSLTIPAAPGPPSPPSPPAPPAPPLSPGAVASAPVLAASYKETLEKQSMGFRMSAWDNKLLKYGERFEKEMMDLSVNIPLEAALDLGWQIMADCFEPEETGISSKLTGKFWPKKTA